MHDADGEAVCPRRSLERPARVLVAEGGEVGLPVEVAGPRQQRFHVIDGDAPGRPRPAEPEKGSPFPARVALKDMLLQKFAVRSPDADEAPAAVVRKPDRVSQIFRSHEMISPM